MMPLAGCGQLQPWELRRLWSLRQMVDFYLPSFLELTKEIGRITNLAGDQYKGTQDQDVVDNNIKAMQGHSQSFSNLSFLMCKLHSDRIIKDMQAGGFTGTAGMFRWLNY
jgi:hypothetical protein